MSCVRPIVYGFTEANSQSFYAGQLVVFSSGVAAAASDTTTGLLGIALKDATNVTSDNIEIPFYPIYSDDDWIIQTTTGGTAKASSDFTQGTKYALYVASNVAYLDYADTSNDSAVFIEPIYRASLTTGIYWAHVRFLAANCYLQVGT